MSRAMARHFYLPPEEPILILPEVIDNRVRSILPRPTALPEVHLKAPSPSEPPNFTYLMAKHAQIQTNDVSNSITINSMSCKNADDELYFRAVVAPVKLRDAPVVEGGASDACKIERTNEEFGLNFSGDLFWNCGVQDCSTESGKFYCLNLRFPAISGLRLKVVCPHGRRHLQMSKNCPNFATFNPKKLGI